MKDSVLDNAFASVSIPDYSQQKREQTIVKAKQRYTESLNSIKDQTRHNRPSHASSSLARPKSVFRLAHLFKNKGLNYGAMAVMSLLVLTVSYSVFEATTYKTLSLPPIERSETDVVSASRESIQPEIFSSESEVWQAQVSKQNSQQGDAANSQNTQELTVQLAADMPVQDYLPGLDRDRLWEPPVSRDQFAHVEQNTIMQTVKDPVSTFSIDTDTASYSFVRRQLEAGRLPPADSVRIEEMINYFDYNYPQTTDVDVPFTVTTQVVPSPWNTNNKLLHIGINAFDLPPDSNRKSNLVFLIDTSGSMQSADKLPLLVNSFRLLLETLSEDDTVAIVTYAGRAGIVLPPTQVKNKAVITSALNQLYAGGSTAGQAGIEQAYSLAEQNYEPEAVNRVFLATDGDFNVGISDPGQLKSYIAKKRDKGVFLSVLGFGEGNYNDRLMQTLAQNGNGQAFYIDTLKEAQKILIEQASSTLFTVAKDVKIQVEFNPDTVAQYRLIGYETRHLATQDFNNDKIDAAEIGAGHTVTAIYEITTVEAFQKQVDKPRYTGNQTSNSQAQALTNEYAFLKIRYKKPDSDKSQKISIAIDRSQQRDTISKADSDVRFAVAVAGFGQLLKRNTDVGNLTYDDIVNLAQGSRGEDQHGYRSEFVSLVKLAKSLN